MTEQISPEKQLANKIAERLLQIKSEGLYCIVDRINSNAFVEVFKDGLNSYRQDAILCERLFFKEKCEPTKVTTYNASEEAQALYQEFLAFSSGLGDGSQDISESQLTKFQEYQERLKNMPPEMVEVDALLYKNGYNGDGYLVSPLSDVPDEVIHNMSEIISGLVFSYFLAMKFVLPENYAINVFPVNYEDWIDILALIDTDINSTSTDKENQG